MQVLKINELLFAFHTDKKNVYIYPEVPDITVEVNQFEVQMNDSLIFVCKVRSLIPIVVKWIHNGLTIKELVSK